MLHRGMNVWVRILRCNINGQASAAAEVFAQRGADAEVMRGCAAGGVLPWARGRIVTLFGRCELDFGVDV